MMLTDNDKKSSLWAKLKKNAEEKLTELRKQNDGDLDKERTDKLRGRIHEIKVFLALDQPAPDEETDED